MEIVSLTQKIETSSMLHCSGGGARILKLDFPINRTHFDMQQLLPFFNNDLLALLQYMYLLDVFVFLNTCLPVSSSKYLGVTSWICD